MGLVLTDEIVDLVNGALASGNAMLLAAITVEGKPRMSYRGSLQALSGDQLSFWVRRVEGATLEGIKVNPEVALMYRDQGKRILLQFAGRARLVTDPEERDRVYAAAPEIEQRADPERKGEGVVIDLDRVEGMLGLNAEGRPNFVRLSRDD